MCLKSPLCDVFKGIFEILVHQEAGTANDLQLIFIVLKFYLKGQYLRSDQSWCKSALVAFKQFDSLLVSASDQIAIQKYVLFKLKHLNLMMIELTDPKSISNIDLEKLDLQKVGLFKSESEPEAVLSLFKDGFALLDAIESDKLQPFMLKMLCILQQATNEMGLVNKDYLEFLIQGL